MPHAAPRFRNRQPMSIESDSQGLAVLRMTSFIRCRIARLGIRELPMNNE
jgi:hypothetical protein